MVFLWIQQAACDMLKKHGNDGSLWLPGALLSEPGYIKVIISPSAESENIATLFLDFSHIPAVQHYH